MPAPMFPPTPAPSTDIAPKPAPNLSNIELSFQLPPPAIGGSSSSSVSSASSTPVSPSRDELNQTTPVSSAKKWQTKRYPPSPPSPNPTGTSLSAYPLIAPMPTQFAPAFPNEKNIPPPPSPTVQPSRKRPSATQAAAAISQQKRKEREEDLLEEQQLSQAKHHKTSSYSSPKGNSSGSSDASGSSSVTLPPPPGRSRKIIQMKPKPDAIVMEANPTSTTTKGKASGGGRKKVTAVAAAVTTPQQIVQLAKPTAATRKTARKTAHSLIERRRRFKMNEEFAVLKSMIPACQGVEMHKLAILQASIEYLRYLEECVEKLKKRSDGGDCVVGKAPGRRQSGSEEEMEDQDQDQDDEMAEGGERDENEDEEEDGEDGEEEDVAVERSGEQSRSRVGSLVGTPLTFIHHQHQLDQRQEPQQQYHQHTPYQGPLQPPPPPPPQQQQQQQQQQQSHQSRYPAYQSSPAPPHPSPPYSRQQPQPQQYTPTHKNPFITTQNIPPEALPPPILSPSTFTAPTYSFPAQSQLQPQTPSVHGTPRVPAYFSPALPPTAPAHFHTGSMSVAASPKTFLPQQSVQVQAEDEDREVTHALLLLKGDGGEQGESSSRESGSVSGRSSGVKVGWDGTGDRPVIKGRTMSVMDLLSS